MDKYINAPISDEDAKSLHSGDYVYITGTIYTARDAAHKRMAEALSAGQPLPIDMKNNIIYYMGPSPAREGRPIGSAGPTTASRMDKYAPDLLDLGLKGMIGKGKRSQAVIDGIVRNGAESIPLMKSNPRKEYYFRRGYPDSATVTKSLPYPQKIFSGRLRYSDNLAPTARKSLSGHHAPDILQM